MKSITTVLFLLTLPLLSCGQTSKYLGELELRTYKIGDKVDIKKFKKYANLAFPDHLDGWTMSNSDKLPKKYAGLPISIWQNKKDSGIALTLIDNIILKITISNIKDDEKDRITKMVSEKFGFEGKVKSYEESHPLQAWITYWNLVTWETNEAIFQIGNSDMRMPTAPIPKSMLWNLVYSDLVLESKILADYKK
ncbi:MAG: hypothetical protein H7Y13_01270 [Sphingobacteriaceae bacterium]|nr:hypothetical protein [Sphingobacteriaceae bacterium]